MQAPHTKSMVVLSSLLAWAMWLMPAASLAVSSDEPSAILVFPQLVVDSAQGDDTWVQIANASASPVDAQCFIENHSGICAFTAAFCLTSADCPSPGDTCENSFSIIDFSISLVPGQPLAWRLSQGLLAKGVPPLASDPFQGVLRCIAMAAGSPSVANSLEGTATLEHVFNSILANTTRYNAIGIKGQVGNGDFVLELGTEYQACPEASVVTHLFDGAVDPIGLQISYGNEFYLIPCGVDYESSTAPEGVVEYVVFNEYGQRTAANERYVGRRSGSLTKSRSTIFDVRTQGTLSGQTRIAPLAGSGIVGIAIQRTLGSGRQGLGDRSTASSLHTIGVRLSVDQIKFGQP